MNYSLSGTWTATLPDNTSYSLTLPGTLDESGIGFPDASTGQIHPDSDKNEHLLAESTVIKTRFTRKHTYKGNVRISKEIKLPQELFQKERPRIFLKAERARCLCLHVNDTFVPPYRETSLSTPYLFELTPVLDASTAMDATTLFTFDSDNSYPGLPAAAILYSSAATDETQTNWNGILGDFCLYTREHTFISDLKVYPVQDPTSSNTTLTVKLTIDASLPQEPSGSCTTMPQTAFHGTLTLTSSALKDACCRELSLTEGIHEITLEQLPLADTVSYWDEDEGTLYELNASLGIYEENSKNNPNSGSITEYTTEHTTFGLRHFAATNGHFTLNGRRIFLRSEANCAVFPETGHPPMTVMEWEDVLRRYRSYGINHLRFHSHCPPEAAFTAADRLGILLQPELSHWDPWHALESEESYQYYKKELRCILNQLANHPSFVMLTLGNELHANETGHVRMQELVQLAKMTDSTRLYAHGSNNEYGTQDCSSFNDFYTTQMHLNAPLRATFACHDKNKRHLEGYLNNQYPSSSTNYDASMDEVRKTYSGPVYTFEVGQYEILPDFEELEDFRGISQPDNYTWIKERVEHAGLLSHWKRHVEATGELSLLAYREEIEAALRTKDLSGISLLGLQDFPGQGTALVGMLNSHLQPKPFDFAKPERFQAFFTEQLPLVLLPKYTYTNMEALEAEVLVANYGKSDVFGSLEYALVEENTPQKNRLETRISTEPTSSENIPAKTMLSKRLPDVACPQGSLTTVGTIHIPLQDITVPARLRLDVRIGSLKNSYPIWVYPDITPTCPASVHETRHLDAQTLEILAQGGTVYLSPDSTKEQLPHSIQGQFTTDFWSVGTFPAQEGGMGLLIDESHPVFAEFPTEFHTNWQWWPMANQRAVILPKQYDSIITQLDSYAYLRPMALLLECRCGGGRLLFSTMGLQNLQEYPEARALLHSIYCYLDSDLFAPAQEIELEALKMMVE